MVSKQIPLIITSHLAVFELNLTTNKLQKRFQTGYYCIHTMLCNVVYGYDKLTLAQPAASRLTLPQ